MGMDLSPRGLVIFVIGIVFLAALVPTALNDLFAVNTSTWDTGAASLWVIVGLAIVASIVLHFVPSKGGKGAS